MYKISMGSVREDDYLGSLPGLLEKKMSIASSHGMVPACGGACHNWFMMLLHFSITGNQKVISV